MSAVINTLIDNICNLMIADIESRKSIHTAVKNCEDMGFVGIQELRQMTERGLPIVATYSAILRISAPVGMQKIKGREMSYSDLLCVIAIFAQDLMQRSQESRY